MDDIYPKQGLVFFESRNLIKGGVKIAPTGHLNAATLCNQVGNQSNPLSCGQDRGCHGKGAFRTPSVVPHFQVSKGWPLYSKQRTILIHLECLPVVGSLMERKIFEIRWRTKQIGQFHNGNEGFFLLFGKGRVLN